MHPRPLSPEDSVLLLNYPPEDTDHRGLAPLPLAGLILFRDDAGALARLMIQIPTEGVAPSCASL